MSAAHRVRLAVVEPVGSGLASALAAAAIPDIEIVIAGPLMTLVRSIDFPPDVAVVVGGSDDLESVAARVGVCRYLGSRVIVLQETTEPSARRVLAAAGADSVVQHREEVVVKLLAVRSESPSRTPIASGRGVVRLSPAESRALSLCSAGASRREAALELAVTVETVKTLLSRARRKREADNRLYR